MTLVISTVASAGIVLSADSRQSYSNRANAIRIGSDHAMKIFKLTPKCGVAISGKAFLREEETKPWKDAGYFVNKFKKNGKLDGLSVKEIATKLGDFLGSFYVKKDIETVKKQIEEQVKSKGTDLAFSDSDSNLIPYTYKDKDGRTVSETSWIETIVMIVTGIDADGIGRAYVVSIPKGITIEKSTDECGALWVGQNDVVNRIINGYDPQIRNLNFVKDAITKDAKGTESQLNSIGYIVNWATITIQDAIDFCILMTRTTESIQRFSDGLQLSPGGIPGVGGEIDIAVITPDEGFRWLRQKKYKSLDSELPIEDTEL